MVLDKNLLRVFCLCLIVFCWLMQTVTADCGDYIVEQSGDFSDMVSNEPACLNTLSANQLAANKDSLDEQSIRHLDLSRPGVLEAILPGREDLLKAMDQDSLRALAQANPDLIRQLNLRDEQTWNALHDALTQDEKKYVWEELLPEQKAHVAVNWVRDFLGLIQDNQLAPDEHIDLTGIPETTLSQALSTTGTVTVPELNGAQVTLQNGKVLINDNEYSLNRLQTGEHTISLDPQGHTDASLDWGNEKLSMNDADGITLTPEGFQIDNAQSIIFKPINGPETKIINAQGVSYSQGKLHADHAELIVKDQTLANIVDNYDSDYTEFTVQTAERVYRDGLKFC